MSSLTGGPPSASIPTPALWIPERTRTRRRGFSESRPQSNEVVGDDDRRGWLTPESKRPAQVIMLIVVGVLAALVVAMLTGGGTACAWAGETSVEATTEQWK